MLYACMYIYVWGGEEGIGGDGSGTGGLSDCSQLLGDCCMSKVVCSSNVELVEVVCEKMCSLLDSIYTQASCY